jgi:hypothetical protein
LKAFNGYQVNRELLSHARRTSSSCTTCPRTVEEIVDEVIGARSGGSDQQNRLHPAGRSGAAHGRELDPTGTPEAKQPTMQDFLDTISQNLSRFDARAAVDILLIAVIIYWVLLLLRGTTAMSVLRGIAVVFIGAFVLARVFDLRVLNYLLPHSFVAVLIAIPIIFQPELRRGSNGWAGRVAPGWADRAMTL